jgi:hypothetical protein
MKVGVLGGGLTGLAVGVDPRHDYGILKRMNVDFIWTRGC